MVSIHVKSSSTSINNDWHFVPESKRDEFLDMTGNMLANISVLINTTHLDLLGYVFDFWNHTYSDKAAELLQVLFKKMDQKVLTKSYVALVKSLNRSETAEKMDLFDKFYKQTLE